MNHPLDHLRHHVSGAIARGEAEPIAAQGPVMTFEQFQATGRDVADLSTIDHIAACGIESGAGRTYLDDTLFIECGTDSGGAVTWYLTIGNFQDISGDRAKFERKLYEFAVSEGYVNAPTG